MKQGDFVYLIENNMHIKRVQVLNLSSGLVLVKLPSGGAIRVHRSRLYELKEDAEKKISAPSQYQETSSVLNRHDSLKWNGQML